MNDRSLNAGLAVLFAVTGAVILALTWLRPMPFTERVMSTLIGSSALLVALVRSFTLKHRADENQQVPVEVGMEDLDRTNRPTEIDCEPGQRVGL
jgi:hypothetical protein